MNMTDTMGSPKLPVMRGPCRTSGLIPPPRLPRHLLKKQKEDEQKKLADKEDGGGGTEPQELGVMERHQREASAYMLAQLRRESLQTASSQLTETPPSSVTASQNRVASHTAQPQGPSSGNPVLVSQKEVDARKEEQRRSHRSQQLIRELLGDRRRQREQEQAEAVGGTAQLTRLQRSLSLTLYEEKKQSQDQPASAVEACSGTHSPLRIPTFSAAESPLTVPRRNSLQDLGSLMVSDSGSSNMESKNNIVSVAVRPPTNPMFISGSNTFLKSMYHPILNHSLSKCSQAENRRTESPPVYVKASNGEDSRTSSAVTPCSYDDHVAGNTERMSRKEHLHSHSLSTLRPSSDSDTERPVRDVQTTMETLSTERGWSESESEDPDRSPPVNKHITTSSDGQSMPLLERKGRSTESKTMSFCKLQIGEGDQSFDFLLVGPAMEKLVDIYCLLNDRRGAKMLRSCISSEDLVEEISGQMGVELVMQKLCRLPPDGQYSVQKLVSLSATPLARREPDRWDDDIHRFEKEGIKGILLKSQEVRYFEPSDYRQPNRERTFRNVDPQRTGPDPARNGEKPLVHCDRPDQKRCLVVTCSAISWPKGKRTVTEHSIPG